MIETPPRDWAKFCERIGYPTSASNLRPCFCCSVSPGPLMHDPTEVSVMDCHWHVNTDDDFDTTMRPCEVSVVWDSESERDCGVPT